MDVELSKVVKYFGLAILLAGLGLSIFGVTVDYPDPSITYIDEYDQRYADENNDRGFRVPIVGGNDGDIPPERVHTYYNSTQLSNESMKALEENIGSDSSFIVEEMNDTAYRGRFIVEFENGTQHVYEGESNGIYPPTLFAVAMIMSFIGFLTYTSMRSTRRSIPEDVEPSDKDEWKYQVEKKD